MPLRTYDTKADFDALYDIGAEGAWGHPNTRPEVRLHYNRSVMLPILRDQGKNMARVLGWTAGTRLVVIGCGFGWSLEAYEEGGLNVIGTDMSAYIQANKTLNEDDDLRTAIRAVGLVENAADGLTLFNALRGDGGPRAKKAAAILNEDGGSGGSRSRIRSAIGGAPYSFEVHTEAVLESLTNAECTKLSGFLHQLSTGRISHLVYSTDLPDDGTWNRKTVAEWKALLPNDVFVRVGTWEVA